MKRALICGVSGQDGAWLAQWLLQEGYDVVGTSRDAAMAPVTNLQRLGIRDRVRRVSMTLTDFRSVLQTLTEVDPDEIYNLAGQSSVALSFEQPVETLESITVGTLNLLEAIRFRGRPIRLYNACSSECFGDTGEQPADETAPFHPRSPYAAAKAAAFWQVANYREAYGLHACSGILFNHESPLRPRRFVTRKIVAAACAIAAGEQDVLDLGNLDVARDWGWAPEYVRAMARMLQEPKAEDYVIATGETHDLRAFVREAFACVGLDWERHTRSRPALLRRTDILTSRANASKAQERLGWRARYRMPDVVRMMVEAEQAGEAGALTPAL